MKILIALILACTLGACTTYNVKRDADGNVDVKVKSTRSFEAPNLHYKRTGEDAEFDFSAANADNNTDALLGAWASIVQMLMQELAEK